MGPIHLTPKTSWQVAMQCHCTRMSKNILFGQTSIGSTAWSPACKALLKLTPSAGLCMVFLGLRFSNEPVHNFTTPVQSCSHPRSGNLILSKQQTLDIQIPSEKLLNPLKTPQFVPPQVFGCLGNKKTKTGQVPRPSGPARQKSSVGKPRSPLTLEVEKLCDLYDESE